MDRCLLIHGCCYAPPSGIVKSPHPIVQRCQVVAVVALLPEITQLPFVGVQEGQVLFALA